MVVKTSLRKRLHFIKFERSAAGVRNDLPFVVESFQLAGHARVPPFPIRDVLAKDVARGGADEGGVLSIGARELCAGKKPVGAVELTKSNAATFLLVPMPDPLFPPYLPTSRLSSTIRHVSGSDSFLETGVKKLETAFSILCVRNENAGG